MTAATKRLAKGDFSVRLPDDKPGELGELLRSFNSMADDLSRTAYLQKDFISSISHEFKTPIASIKGYARLLQMPGLDEESRNEYVNMIAGESERLSHMSQTLLRLTSLEEQMMPATVTTFRLDEQLREVLVQLAPAWENRKIDWQLELSPVTIASDEELLRQVWVNLIQNAVKFSDEGAPSKFMCTGQEMRWLKSSTTASAWTKLPWSGFTIAFIRRTPPALGKAWGWDYAW